MCALRSEHSIRSTPATHYGERILYATLRPWRLHSADADDVNILYRFIIRLCAAISCVHLIQNGDSHERAYVHVLIGV